MLLVPQTISQSAHNWILWSLTEFIAQHQLFSRPCGAVVFGTPWKIRGLEHLVIRSQEMVKT